MAEASVNGQFPWKAAMVGRMRFDFHGKQRAIPSDSIDFTITAVTDESDDFEGTDTRPRRQGGLRALQGI
jgi:hypothetical protein